MATVRRLEDDEQVRITRLQEATLSAARRLAVSTPWATTTQVFTATPFSSCSHYDSGTWRALKALERMGLVRSRCERNRLLWAIAEAKPGA